MLGVFRISKTNYDNHILSLNQPLNRAHPEQDILKVREIPMLLSLTGKQAAVPKIRNEIKPGQETGKQLLMSLS